MITCLITLSLEKEIIVLEKSLEKILKFGSKNNRIPKEGDRSFHFLPLTVIVIYIFFKFQPTILQRIVRLCRLEMCSCLNSYNCAFGGQFPLLFRERSDFSRRAQSANRAWS